MLLTDYGIAEVPAHCSGTVLIPPVITDISPSSVSACLHSTFIHRAPVHDSDVTIVAFLATNDGSVHVVSTHGRGAVGTVSEVGFTTGTLELARNDVEIALSISSSRNSNMVYTWQKL